jgi:hypothetical protein
MPKELESRSADILAQLLINNGRSHFSDAAALEFLNTQLQQAKAIVPETSGVPIVVSKWIVGTLCISLLICVFGIFGSLLFLSYLDPISKTRVLPEVPNALVALTSGLLGALTGFLAPSPFNRR